MRGLCASVVEQVYGSAGAEQHSTLTEITVFHIYVNLKHFFSKLVNEEKRRYKAGHLPSGLQCRGLTYSLASLLIGYWRKINEVCYPNHNISYSEIILIEQQQQSQKNENSNKNTFFVPFFLFFSSMKHW